MNAALRSIAASFAVAALCSAPLAQAASDAIKSLEKQAVLEAFAAAPDEIGSKVNNVEGQVRGNSPAPKPSSGAATKSGVHKIEKQVVPSSSATMPGTSGSLTAAAKKLKPDVVLGASSLGGAASKVIGN